MDVQRTGPNPEFIHSMFGQIAPTYDLANDMMTFGLARVWRQQLVNWSELLPASKVLDCATGTGDLAIAFKKAVGPLGQVYAIDFVGEMLRLGKRKAERKKLPVNFEIGDVTRLRFNDGEFRVTSIAYGLRNVSDPSRAVREMARVTASGGHVMILETGETTKGLMQTMLHWYLRNAVPRIGGWISGQQEAYEYLQKSSQAFPAQEKMVEWLKSSGCFKKVTYKSLLGGASYIYKATVN